MHFRRRWASRPGLGDAKAPDFVQQTTFHEEAGLVCNDVLLFMWQVSVGKVLRKVAQRRTIVTAMRQAHLTAQAHHGERERGRERGRGGGGEGEEERGRKPGANVSTLQASDYPSLP